MKISGYGVVAVLSVAALVGCQNTQGFNGQGGGLGGMGTKQTVGAVGGAVLGGWAGSNIGGGKGAIIATGAGTLLGALLGSSLGKSLDKADLAYANQAQNQAYNAPIGQTINWNNPQSGNRGTITPVNDGYRSSGEYCRQYNQTIYVDGQTQTATGTACRQSNGTWQIVG